VGLTAALLVREGVDDPFVRFRAAALAAAADSFCVLSVRTPQRSPPSAATEPPGLSARIVGKLTGIYATHARYPSAYYDGFDSAIGDARRRCLPASPPLSAYSQAIIEAERVNSPDVAAEIRRREVDVLAPLAGIIRPVLLEAPRLGCLNSHHGWLPSIRGLWSTVWAIVEDRADWVGQTVHWMDTGLDTGPILARARPAFSRDDDHASLYVRLDLMSGDLIGDALARLKRRDAATIPNPAADGTYRSRVTFRASVAFARRERPFFHRHGTPGVAPLTMSSHA